jgi:outer membrane protein OmpA-like peptidoglycan-associated protein
MLTEDWSVDVKKYVPDADDGIIAGIVRYCGIALRKVDSSLVAFSDPKETARVRDGYCRKKLGLTESDADVDAAIAAVGERMKADRTKNRVTVYYLLAEHYGKLGLFAPKAKAGARTAGAGAAGAGAAVAATAMGAAGAAAMTSGGASGDGEPAAVAAPTPVAPPAPPAPPPPAAPAVAADATPAGLMSGAAAAGATAAAAVATTAAAAPTLTKTAEHHDDVGAGWTQPVGREPTGGFMFGTVLGVLGLIIGAALLAWFISSRMGGTPDAAAPVVAAAPAPVAPAAPPAPPPTPPEGSGVIATEVAGRPMVSVFFDSGSALIASDFATVAAPIKAWLDANPGDMAQVSGFNDPTGNAAFNADLSRRRAEGVAAALRDLGVADNQIDLEPPASATDASTDLAGARRVEITVVPLS